MSGEYGTDIKWNGDDIFPSLEMQNTEIIVLEAISRRLMSDPTSLFYDEKYGYNLANLLKSPFLPSSVEIENECLKDERISMVICTITQSTINESLTISLQIKLNDSDSIFNLVFSLSDTDGADVAYEKIK
jgi:hypothetical protein